METTCIVREELCLWSCNTALQHYSENYNVDEVMYKITEKTAWHDEIYFKVWVDFEGLNWEFCSPDSESYGLSIFEFDHYRYDPFRNDFPRHIMLLMDMYMWKTGNNIRSILRSNGIGFESFEFTDDKCKIDFWMVENIPVFIQFITTLFRDTFTVDQIQDMIQDYHLDPDILKF